METQLRIATFNLENLDDGPKVKPTLQERIAVLRPQFLRLNADILCLQEVNGQEQPGQPRELLALNQVLSGTPYASFAQASTKTADGSQVYDLRNLVILSRYPIVERRQYLQEFIAAPRYQLLTATPPESAPKPVLWERPILYRASNCPRARCSTCSTSISSRSCPAPFPAQWWTSTHGVRPAHGPKALSSLP